MKSKQFYFLVANFIFVRHASQNASISSRSLLFNNVFFIIKKEAMLFQSNILELNEQAKFFEKKNRQRN